MRIRLGKLALPEIPEFEVRVQHKRTSTIISYQEALLLLEFQKGLYFGRFGEMWRLDRLVRDGLLYRYEDRRYGLTKKAEDAKYTIIRKQQQKYSDRK